MGVKELKILSSVIIFMCLCRPTASVYAQETAYAFTIEQVKGHVFITLSTVSPLPCIGSAIRNRVVWDSDTTVVLLSGFVRPVPCIEGMEPASAQIDLGRDTSNVRYLKIQEDAFTDLWKMLREGESIRVTSVHKTFTSYSH